MDNLRGLVGIRMMDRVLKARIWELCGVNKSLDERIDEGVLRWFAHAERIEKDKIGKKVYVGECAGSCSVGSHGGVFKGKRFGCQASKENGGGL